MRIKGLCLLQYEIIIIFFNLIFERSTKGVGATAPDFSEVETLEDGAVVPLGKPKQRSDVKVILLY